MHTRLRPGCPGTACWRISRSDLAGRTGTQMIRALRGAATFMLVGVHGGARTDACDFDGEQLGADIGQTAGHNAIESRFTGRERTLY